MGCPFKLPLASPLFIRHHPYNKFVDYVPIYFVVTHLDYVFRKQFPLFGWLSLPSTSATFDSRKYCILPCRFHCSKGIRPFPTCQFSLCSFQNFRVCLEIVLDSSLPLCAYTVSRFYLGV